MFKKNTAVPNFVVGCFIQTADGAQKTTGTPTGAFIADGVAGALTGSASYDVTAGCWTWSEVQAAAMNGDVVGLVFNLADCLPVEFTIRTSAKLVSELNDLAQSAIVSDGIAFPGGDIDAALSTLAVPGSAMTLTAAYDAAKTAAQAGNAMALTSGERTTLAGVVWGYTDRTLTSLAALVSSIAAAVWGYATRVLTSSSTAPGTGLTAETWRVIRGDSLDRTFSTIAADASITKVQLTVKERPITEADTDSILLVDSVTGLVYLNKAAPDSAYTATFTTAGVLAVTAATMAQVAPGRVYYDVQVWRGAATQTIETGTFVVGMDVGRSTAAA